MGKRHSSTNGNGKIEQLHAKESHWTALSHHSQNKFTKEAIKLLEKNSSTIFANGPHNIFLYASQHRWNKSKNKQIGLHQTMKFLHREMLSTKGSATEWEKIFVKWCEL